MTTEQRLLAILNSIHYVVSNRIPGDIVECGVWRGGSMMAATQKLLAAGDNTRQIFLYDTFEGMSAPTEADRNMTGISAKDLMAQRTEPWCYAGLDDVKRNLASTGYPPERLHYVRGKVEETAPRTIPDQIALLRLDTDWYESTKHELDHFYPKLAKHGILIIDDYGHWEGARKATDEYFATLRPRPFLHRIDYTGRLVVKP